MVKQELIDTMLHEYDPAWRYLKSAKYNWPKVTARFSIEKTPYGSESGHLNATLMMNAYNQLAYVFYAKAIEEGRIEQIGKIPLDKFVERQMNCLLTGLDKVKLRGEINSKDFIGETEFERSLRRKDRVFVKSTFSFYDNNGGLAEGISMLTLGPIEKPTNL